MAKKQNWNQWRLDIRSASLEGALEEIHQRLPKLIDDAFVGLKDTFVPEVAQKIYDQIWEEVSSELMPWVELQDDELVIAFRISEEKATADCRSFTLSEAFSYDLDDKEMRHRLAEKLRDLAYEVDHPDYDAPTAA